MNGRTVGEQGPEGTYKKRCHERRRVPDVRVPVQILEEDQRREADRHLDDGGQRGESQEMPSEYGERLIQESSNAAW